MDEDFNYFLDSVLIEAVNRQSDLRIKRLCVSDLCLSVRTDVPPTWIDLTVDRIRSLNYGDLLRDSERPNEYWFEINGNGLSRVHQARIERRPASFTDQVASDKVQKIGTLALSACSFIVSLFALWIAFLAYVNH